MIRHLYLHIPFCHRRCAYCDFNTYANMEDRIAAYVDALCAELRMRAGEDALRGGGRASRGGKGAVYAQIPVAPERAAASGAPEPQASATLTIPNLLPTIFLGGGTPTMLTAAQLEQILTAADAIVPLEGAEITIEANPGTVLGADYLRDIRSLGVNRISMGVQSLDDPTLRVLGRIHSAAEARRSYQDARTAGFERVNLDFIFGLPGQTVARWDAALREISTWGADHFSLYSLIVEPGTPLHAQVTGGRVSVPDDDETGAMYESAIERLAAAGYAQYEISNWATSHGGPTALAGLPRQACHHNLAYWLNADYLAAGAGAHAHQYPQRYADILGVDPYIAAVGAGQLPTAETTELTPRDLMAETMFMGLRLNVGVSFAHFRDRCGAELAEVYAAEIADLARLGLLAQDSDRVWLTERGRMLGNQVFMRFL